MNRSDAPIPRPALLAVAVFLVGSLLVVIAARDLWRPCIRGDGVGYYAPLASMLVDGDLELGNELGHLNPRYLQAAFMTPSGQLGDPFPVGPALLWLPVVQAVRALPAHAGLDAPLLETAHTPHPAFAPRYARALWGANIVLVLLGGSVLVATCVAASGGVGWAGAAGAGLAGVFGTPVVYYTLADPSYGHAASFAVTALFVAAMWRDRRKRVRLEWLGLAWGLVALVRSQDAALGVLLVPRLRAEWRGTQRARLWRFAVPALLAFAPQMLFWQRIYGRPLLVPPGPDFLPAWQPHIFHLLFSTWNGVLPWSPVLVLGLAGWALVRDRPLRWAMVVALALVLYSSALLLDWWGGNAFGPRRLVSLVPLAIVGLAQLLQGARTRTLPVALALALMCAINLRVAEYKVHGLLPGNPGNAADYVRHYTPGSKSTYPYGHLDYPRLIREGFEAERMLRLRKSRD